MAIRKQEFYEGAALHQVARGGRIASLRYEPPFFLFNHRLAVLLKYSTKTRSPWAFTFTIDEQSALQSKASQIATVIGLICGADGIATLSYDSFLRIATPQAAATRISCQRRYDEHYEVSGPGGSLDRKVAPSNWQKILQAFGEPVP